jgi:hypothetical protein
LTQACRSRWPRMASERETRTEHTAYGTLEEVAADAMICAEPWTLIHIKDDEGVEHIYLVSHWLQA